VPAERVEEELAAVVKKRLHSNDDSFEES
jgi:hypothetical protein